MPLEREESANAPARGAAAVCKSVLRVIMAKYERTCRAMPQLMNQKRFAESLRRVPRCRLRPVALSLRHHTHVARGAWKSVLLGKERRAENVTISSVADTSNVFVVGGSSPDFHLRIACDQFHCQETHSGSRSVPQENPPSLLGLVAPDLSGHAAHGLSFGL